MHLRLPQFKPPNCLQFLLSPTHSQHGHEVVRFVSQKDHPTLLLKTLPWLLTVPWSQVREHSGPPVIWRAHPPLLHISRQNASRWTSRL